MCDDICFRAKVVCSSQYRLYLCHKYGQVKGLSDKIISAQKARGADFDSGGLVQKAKALIPILIPLFISSFRRAEELAIAMECRCYHGDEGRTSLRQLVMAGRDWGLLVFSIALCAGIVVLRCFGL